MKHIVHNNPVSFLAEFCDAVRDGYYLDNNKYALVLMPNIVEATLEKGEIPEPDVKDIVVNLSSYSFPFLCEKIQYFVAHGWNIDYSSLVVDVIGRNSVSLVRHIKKHTKEELDAMEWTEIGNIGKSLGVFNRKREVMTAKILKVYEEN